MNHPTNEWVIYCFNSIKAKSRPKDQKLPNVRKYSGGSRPENAMCLECLTSGNVGLWAKILISVGLHWARVSMKAIRAGFRAILPLAYDLWLRHIHKCKCRIFASKFARESNFQFCRTLYCYIRSLISYRNCEIHVKSILIMQSANTYYDWNGKIKVYLFWVVHFWRLKWFVCKQISWWLKLTVKSIKWHSMWKAKIVFSLSEANQCWFSYTSNIFGWI